MSFVLKREINSKRGMVVETLTDTECDDFAIATNNARSFANVREAKTYYNAFLQGNKQHRGIHFIEGPRGGTYSALNGWVLK